MITIEEVQQRISQLNELSAVMLESEMDYLKETLLQNENITQNLLPEDIGEIVKALEKIQGRMLEPPTTTRKKTAQAPIQFKEIKKIDLSLDL